MIGIILRLANAMLVTVTMSTAVHAAEPAMTVFKTSGCGCCQKWITLLEDAGLKVIARDVTSGELMQRKRKAGLKAEHASCHTGEIAGYVVEGHVPIREIRRLISERPQAVGLAVPGMPMGSPGMEAGGETEPYEVLLVRKDGSAEPFARYP